MSKSIDTPTAPVTVAPSTGQFVTNWTASAKSAPKVMSAMAKQYDRGVTQGDLLPALIVAVDKAILADRTAEAGVRKLPLDKVTSAIRPLTESTFKAYNSVIRAVKSAKLDATDTFLLATAQSVVQSAAMPATVWGPVLKKATTVEEFVTACAELTTKANADRRRGKAKVKAKVKAKSTDPVAGAVDPDGDGPDNSLSIVADALKLVTELAGKFAYATDDDKETILLMLVDTFPVAILPEGATVIQ